MSEPALDLQACVQQVRGGDQEAARLLVNHLYPLVLKLVRAHLPRRTAEEDLVQVVFMKMFAKLEQFSGTVPLEHWVSRIAVNTCLNQLSSEKVRPELRWADLSEEHEEVLETLTAAESGPEPSEALAARELVAQLLAHLSPEDRLVVSLIHLEEKSVSEVQKLTGWSATAIKVRAFRARRRLKKHLERLLKEQS